MSGQHLSQLSSMFSNYPLFGSPQQGPAQPGNYLGMGDPDKADLGWGAADIGGVTPHQARLEQARWRAKKEKGKGLLSKEINQMVKARGEDLPPFLKADTIRPDVNSRPKGNVEEQNPLFALLKSKPLA